MADVDIQKIIETLKQRFKGPQQFIFWYDDHGEFQDQVEEIRQGLQGTAQVVILTMGHQLKIKRDLLALSPDNKVLVYSPEPQPQLAEDHLRSIMLYSGTFTADSVEILRKELGFPESLRQFIKDHQKFFESKERRQKLLNYDLKSYLVVPELAIMAVLARLKQPLVDFFDILQLVMAAGVTDNQILADFEKYQVSQRFWTEIHARFGYTAEQPQLQDFVTGVYLTTAYQQMHQSMPKNLAAFNLSQDLANVQTLIQQFGSRNQGTQPDHFKELGQAVWQSVHGTTLFSIMDIDSIAKADVFPQFDEMILLWIQDRLNLKDVDSQLNGQSIEQLTKWRVDTTHYGQTYQAPYQMMRKAWYLVRDTLQDHKTGKDLSGLIEDYVTSGYKTDTDYRKFIRDYQKVNMSDTYLPTKRLIDSLYVQDNLDNSIHAWTEQFTTGAIDSPHLQRNFYKYHVASETNRIVVIISDAFRFEAAKELEKRLRQSDQVTGLKMDYLVTGLPSVTYMGMPAMLPHRDLALTTKELLVDGQPAVNREQRAMILQQQNSASAAYALDELKNAPSAEIREKFAGKQVVYIYHNQIDTTADNPKSEDGTFQATDEAIAEIQLMIRRLRTLSISHVLVTADHGYLYRDDQLDDGDKIEIQKESDDIKSQRYLITSREITMPGIGRQQLGDLLENSDSRYVYYPKTSKTFRAPGGSNYTHGGASLQEMVVPLLDVRTTTNRSAAQDVQLELVNATKRITSLEVPIVVRQSEPIGATVIPATFDLYFVDDQNRHISGLVSINANSRSAEVQDRIQHTTIVLADRHYDKASRYYLVIENQQNPNERQKIAFVMDIASWDNFES